MFRLMDICSMSKHTHSLVMEDTNRLIFDPQDLYDCRIKLCY